MKEKEQQYEAMMRCMACERAAGRVWVTFKDFCGKSDLKPWSGAGMPPNTAKAVVADMCRGEDQDRGGMKTWCRDLVQSDLKSDFEQLLRTGGMSILKKNAEELGYEARVPSTDDEEEKVYKDVCLPLCDFKRALRDTVKQFSDKARANSYGDSIFQEMIFVVKDNWLLSLGIFLSTGAITVWLQMKIFKRYRVAVLQQKARRQAIMKSKAEALAQRAASDSGKRKKE